VYLAARVPAGGLAALRRLGAAAGLAGFNVTAPLKEEAAALCAGRTDVARELGAVNTVKVDGERWLGHNTDSAGVVAVLAEAWRGRPAPDRAVVLGAGGAARAAIHALDRWGVNAIEVRNRSRAGCRRLETWLERATWPRRASTSVRTFADGPPGAAPIAIVTLAGGVDPTPFLPPAAESTSGPPLVLDLRYGDQLPTYEPPSGSTLVDGLPVLVMQGGLAFAWWFGPPIPWQAMRRAVAGDE
jgi:shikimate dehydrogenase